MIYRISVLITTYNCADYIVPSIQSVLNQTYTHFELLIVDDGSIDGTDEKVNQIIDNRIRFEKIDHVGRSAALNYGINKCKYDWIAFQDADDIWNPSKLELQIQLINNPADFIICNAAYFTKSKISYMIESPSDFRELRKIWALHGHIATSSLLIKKQILLSCNGFNGNLRSAVDYELFLRLKNKITLGVVNKFCVYIRIRKNSLSRSFLHQRNKIIYNIQEKYYKNLSTNFHITNNNTQIKLIYWREWFYGDKKKARNFWLKNPSFIFEDYRIIFAFLMTYLPPYLFELLKGMNFKNRLIYIFKTDRKTKKMFNRLLREFE